MNPLLSPTTLPLFDAIRPEHVVPAIETLLAGANQALETVTATDFPAQWESIARELGVATEKLGRAWGAVSHLKSVADNPELRAAYNAALPHVTEFWTRLGADERLFAKYKAIDLQTLNPEQRQAHKNAMRNFVLGGAELTEWHANALQRSRTNWPHSARNSAKTRWMPQTLSATTLPKPKC